MAAPRAACRAARGLPRRVLRRELAQKRRAPARVNRDVGRTC